MAMTTRLKWVKIIQITTVDLVSTPTVADTNANAIEEITTLACLLPPKKRKGKAYDCGAPPVHYSSSYKNCLGNKRRKAHGPDNLLLMFTCLLHQEPTHKQCK
jgi:hypothetical protein